MFLSTDAGGVGLNLQFAQVVVNLDLPWNPAVLEQRIGRVHRLGQKGTGARGQFRRTGNASNRECWACCKFKKSIFSGVLDEGSKDVFLGGTRLRKVPGNGGRDDRGHTRR